MLDGCRHMVAYRFRSGLDPNDPDMLTFAGIESQCDHLPLGSVRQYWDPVALARADREIAEEEAFHRPAALAACESLIRRLDPAYPHP